MKFTVLILLLLNMQTLFAKTTNNTYQSKAESELQNYGFSYCLSKTYDESLREEAVVAMHGYFEMGNHSEEAYANIRSYIDLQLYKTNDVYKISGKKAYLMRCIEVFNSRDYLRKVKKQHKFIID